MRTKIDPLAPIDRGRELASVLIGLKIRHLGAVARSAECQPTGSCPNADVFAHQISWGAGSYATHAAAEAAIADYIDGFYNPCRRHSSIGYATPIEFELKARIAAGAA